MNKCVGSAVHEQGVENARKLFPRGVCPGHSPGAGGHGTTSLVKVPSPAMVQVDRESHGWEAPGLPYKEPCVRSEKQVPLLSHLGSWHTVGADKYQE